MTRHGHLLQVCALLAAPVLMYSSDQTRPPTDAYLLGPGDQINVWAVEVEELSQHPVRIDDAGFVQLPMVGQVHAAGLTPRSLSDEIARALKKYVQNPEVTVGIAEFRSQPVSVLGAVNSPGVHYLQGSKTLVEAISLAGGLRNDAGFRITLTRRAEWGAIPIEGAKQDSSGRYSVAEINVKSLLEAKSPALNIPVRPNDVIAVPRAQMVYVIGEVERAGGFVLGDERGMSVLQALSLAGGLTRSASAKKAKILRHKEGAEHRAEEPVNVSRLLAGKASDRDMGPQDILFVPNNKAKTVALRAVEAAVSTGSGIAVWRTSR